MAQFNQHTTGLKKGDVLKGKYEVLALIGKGGMSRVFLARDLDLVNKQWAIKEVDRNAKDPMGRPIEQSLASEAELLSKLSHPSIVDIVDIERTDRFIYVVMDHIEGVSLDKVVRQKGPQQEEDVQEWMLQICDALGYLHRQNPPIIYRDVKPNNIMLHPDGYVKLIDLGVAREYKDEQKKDTIAFGTTGYAAPEQYGKSQTDPRTDIYGVGATMWHLLGGTAPPVEFPLPNVREANPNVSEGFADVIIPKCTALERSERYQSTDELMADLSIYRELTKEYRDTQKRKVKRFVGVVIGALACLLLGFISLGVRDFTITSSYENLVQMGRTYLHSGQNTEAHDQFVKAIEVKPNDIKGYQGLIDSYKDNGGVFSRNEKQELNSIYENNLDELKRSNIFGELNYLIGTTIYHYYDEGNADEVSKIKNSLAYFQAAADDERFAKENPTNHEMAEMYANIANYYNNRDSIVQSRDTEKLKEMYGRLLDGLRSLSDNLGNASDPLFNLDNTDLLTNALYDAIAGGMKQYAALDANTAESFIQNIQKELSIFESQPSLDAAKLAKTKSDFTKLQHAFAFYYSNATVPGGAL